MISGSPTAETPKTPPHSSSIHPYTHSVGEATAVVSHVGELHQKPETF